MTTWGNKSKVVGYNTLYVSFWREFGEATERHTVTQQPLDPYEYNELYMYEVITPLKREDFFNKKFFPRGIDSIRPFTHKIGRQVYPYAEADAAV